MLIETSGVALPGSVVQAMALLPGLDIDGVVVLADAETVGERPRDQYMSDTVLAQLAERRSRLLNKIDLVTEQVSAASAWLKQVAPRARVLPARYAGLPAELILARLDTQPAGRFFATEHDASSFAAINFEVTGNGDPELLARALADASLRLLRVKGIVHDRQGALVAVHVMGQRSSVELAPAGTGGLGRLVCIGLAHEMEAKAVIAAITACPPFSARAI